jgi:hypothetical protein
MVVVHNEDLPEISRRSSVLFVRRNLDDEVAALIEMRRSIRKYLHLTILVGHVHDRVPNEVHELELPVDPGRPHVADGDINRFGARFFPQHLSHVGR